MFLRQFFIGLPLNFAWCTYFKLAQMVKIWIRFLKRSCLSIDDIEKKFAIRFSQEISFPTFNELIEILICWLGWTKQTVNKKKKLIGQSSFYSSPCQWSNKERLMIFKMAFLSICISRVNLSTSVYRHQRIKMNWIQAIGT